MNGVEMAGRIGGGRRRRWQRSFWRTPQGAAGLVLLAIFWPLNWTLPGMRTAFLFFPLWLGFILTVDGLVAARTGTSIWSRSRKEFVLLFLLSAPAWWLFEMINSRTDNWEYLGSNTFTQLEYYVLCSVSFSTVMPAIFEAAELMRSFAWAERFGDGPRLPVTRKFAGLVFVTGMAMLALALEWPKYFYPFVWTSVVFLLEPLNWFLGRPTLLERASRGDWRPAAGLAAGSLLCGFFWEMWNYYSWPKWTYHTPGAQYLHIFEMPLLGYGGYIPFALELYALRSLVLPKGWVSEDRLAAPRPVAI